MTIRQRCEKMKAQAEVELAAVSSEEEHSEALVATLYELSRSILGDMGKPSRSAAYLEGQNAVLELIGFLGLALIRDALHNARAVAVLVEIAEGCADPVVQKKLTTYAAELRTKTEVAAKRQRLEGRRSSVLLVVGALAAFAVLYYATPTRLLQPNTTARPAEAAQQEAAAPGILTNGAVPAVSQQETPPLRTVSAGADTPALPHVQQGERLSGEQVTRVRVVGNQVLVPVTLRNAGQSVRVHLLLDTGASRTALRDSVASKLGIDLTRAKVSIVELADGRELRSHRATVELLSVGPQGAAGLELELYPYSGGREGYDGLLGMDFLGRCRYQVDLENEVIRWY